MWVTAEARLTQRLLCVQLSCAERFVLRPPTWQALFLVPCDRWRGGVESVTSAREAWGKAGSQGVTPGARLQTSRPDHRAAQPLGTPCRRPCPSLPRPPHLPLTPVACCFHSPCLSQFCPLSVSPSWVCTAAAVRPPSFREAPASMSRQTLRVPCPILPFFGRSPWHKPLSGVSHLFPSVGHQASRDVPQKVLFPSSVQPLSPASRHAGQHNQKQGRRHDAALSSLWPAAEQPRACRCGQELLKSSIFRNKGPLDKSPSLLLPGTLCGPGRCILPSVSLPHMHVVENGRPCFTSRPVKFQ